MPVPNNDNQPPTTAETEQYVLNYSFDQIFKILMVGLAGYNSDTDSYDRIETDASGGLKTSGLTAFDAGGTLRNLTAIQSTDVPGRYGLLVLNADGSSLSAGGVVVAPDGTFDSMDGTDLSFMDSSDMAFMAG